MDPLGGLGLWGCKALPLIGIGDNEPLLSPIPRLNCLHGAIPIAPAASDFPFRLLVDAVTHVFSVFRVCKVP